MDPEFPEFITRVGQPPTFRIIPSASGWSLPSRDRAQGLQTVRQCPVHPGRLGVSLG